MSYKLSNEIDIVESQYVNTIFGKSMVHLQYADI